MKRLTDRKTAADLKANAEKLRAAGLEPSEIDKRYMKLAAYEDAEEFIEMTTHAPVLSYHTAALKAALEKGKYMVYFGIDTTKSIWDELASYAIDEDPQEETKWAKENPALTPFIKQRFMKRR